MSGFAGGIISDRILRVNVERSRGRGNGYCFRWAREDRTVVEGVDVKCRVVVLGEDGGEIVFGEEVGPGVGFDIGPGGNSMGASTGASTVERVLRLTPVPSSSSSSSSSSSNSSSNSNPTTTIGWESRPFKGNNVITFECERTFSGFKVLEKLGETLGSNIWDSAVVTAEVLQEMVGERDWGKSKVLDLSAGCGYLPLRLLFSLGARIDSCECKGKTLDLLRENCERVGLGEDKVFACDWGEEVGRGVYDVVLLSDCLYDVSRLGDLKKTLER
ncbi:hypothetical protein TL16_g01048 [Triparma laevis f. inornata]|uniref:Uncharacterized protein n=2 Tax=Triparma laevis TaxID=1534972 RepID=A0A9W7FV80_9STRA|nr:hypothetical protein TL16_g01048 [Triparma laevis f. inornata]GMI18595.1 hypothetical protein TrLO_g8974 [Triparma laevis f. longispina]